MKIKKNDLPVAPIFGIDIKFPDKFIIVLLTLLLILTTLLLSVLNAFRAKFDDLVAFNDKVSNIAILLKS